MSKYNAKRTGKYASRGEANRALQLRIMERQGLISDLREQVKYELLPKQAGERSASYIADFVYIQNGQTVVEDYKGVKTDVYILKRKMMLYFHGIKIKETR
jgi:hypothetical protein